MAGPYDEHAPARVTGAGGPEQVRQARTYADHMLSRKQIRRRPDFATVLDTSCVDAMAAT